MSAIFDSILSGGFSISMFLACLAAAGLCGLVASLMTAKSGEASKGFLISLVVLPMVVCTVILMVNGSVGTAIFLVMTAGLACAAGYVVIALLFTILVSAVILVLSHLSFGQKNAFELHITVPETLQFAGAFDDLFAKYTNSHRLVKTRTTNMGSLYKLSYDIELKDPTASQAFMDELRCRNGNLEILICEKMEGSDSL